MQFGIFFVTPDTGSGLDVVRLPLVDMPLPTAGNGTITDGHWHNLKFILHKVDGHWRYHTFVDGRRYTNTATGSPMAPSSVDLADDPQYLLGRSYAALDGHPAFNGDGYADVVLFNSLTTSPPGSAVLRNQLFDVDDVAYMTFTAEEQLCGFPAHVNHALAARWDTCGAPCNLQLYYRVTPASATHIAELTKPFYDLACPGFVCRIDDDFTRPTLQALSNYAVTDDAGVAPGSPQYRRLDLDTQRVYGELSVRAGVPEFLTLDSGVTAGTNETHTLYPGGARFGQCTPAGAFGGGSLSVQFAVSSARSERRGVYLTIHGGSFGTAAPQSDFLSLEIEAVADRVTARVAGGRGPPYTGTIAGEVFIDSTPAGGSVNAFDRTVFNATLAVRADGSADLRLATHPTDADGSAGAGGAVVRTVGLPPGATHWSAMPLECLNGTAALTLHEPGVFVREVRFHGDDAFGALTHYAPGDRSGDGFAGGAAALFAGSTVAATVPAITGAGTAYTSDLADDGLVLTLADANDACGNPTTCPPQGSDQSTCEAVANCAHTPGVALPVERAAGVSIAGPVEWDLSSVMWGNCTGGSWHDFAMDWRGDPSWPRFSAYDAGGNLVFDMVVNEFTSLTTTFVRVYAPGGVTQLVSYQLPTAASNYRLFDYTQASRRMRPYSVRVDMRDPGAPTILLKQASARVIDQTRPPIATLPNCPTRVRFHSWYDTARLIDIRLLGADAATPVVTSDFATAPYNAQGVPLLSAPLPPVLFVDAVPNQRWLNAASTRFLQNHPEWPGRYHGYAQYRNVGSDPTLDRANITVSVKPGGQFFTLQATQAFFASPEGLRLEYVAPDQRTLIEFDVRFSGNELLADVSWLGGDSVWRTQPILTSGNGLDIEARNTFQISDGGPYLADQPTLHGITAHERWAVGVNSEVLYVHSTQVSIANAAPFFECPAPTANRTACMGLGAGKTGCFWEADSRLSPGGTGPRCDHCPTATDVASECTNPADPGDEYNNVCQHERARGACRATDCPLASAGEAACLAHPSGQCVWTEAPAPVFGVPVGMPAPGSQFDTAPVHCPTGVPESFFLRADIMVNPGALPGDALYIRLDGPPGTQQFMEYRIAVPPTDESAMDVTLRAGSKVAVYRNMPQQYWAAMPTSMDFAQGIAPLPLRIWIVPSLGPNTAGMSFLPQHHPLGNPFGPNVIMDIDPYNLLDHFECFTDLRIWQTRAGAWNVTNVGTLNNSLQPQTNIPLNSPAALADTLTADTNNPTALAAGWTYTTTSCARAACPAPALGAFACSATDPLCAFTAGSAAPLTQAAGTTQRLSFDGTASFVGPVPVPCGVTAGAGEQDAFAFRFEVAAVAHAPGATLAIAFEGAGSQRLAFTYTQEANGVDVTVAWEATDSTGVHTFSNSATSALASALPVHEFAGWGAWLARTAPTSPTDFTATFFSEAGGMLDMFTAGAATASWPCTTSATIVASAPDVWLVRNLQTFANASFVAPAAVIHHFPLASPALLRDTVGASGPFETVTAPTPQPCPGAPYTCPATSAGQATCDADLSCQWQTGGPEYRSITGVNAYSATTFDTEPALTCTGHSTNEVYELVWQYEVDMPLGTESHYGFWAEPSIGNAHLYFQVSPSGTRFFRVRSTTGGQYDYTIGAGAMAAIVPGGYNTFTWYVQVAANPGTASIWMEINGVSGGAPLVTPSATWWCPRFFGIGGNRGLRNLRMWGDVAQTNALLDIAFGPGPFTDPTPALADTVGPAVANFASWTATTGTVADDLCVHVCTQCPTTTCTAHATQTPCDAEAGCSWTGSACVDPCVDTLGGTPIPGTVANGMVAAYNGLDQSPADYEANRALHAGAFFILNWNLDVGSGHAFGTCTGGTTFDYVRFEADAAAFAHAASSNWDVYFREATPASVNRLRWRLKFLLSGAPTLQLTLMDGAVSSDSTALPLAPFDPLRFHRYGFALQRTGVATYFVEHLIDGQVMHSETFVGTVDFGCLTHSIQSSNDGKWGRLDNVAVYTAPAATSQNPQYVWTFDSDDQSELLDRVAGSVGSGTVDYVTRNVDVAHLTSLVCDEDFGDHACEARVQAPAAGQLSTCLGAFLDDVEIEARVRRVSTTSAESELVEIFLWDPDAVNPYNTIGMHAQLEFTASNGNTRMRGSTGSVTTTPGLLGQLAQGASGHNAAAFTVYRWRFTATGAGSWSVSAFIDNVQVANGVATSGTAGCPRVLDLTVSGAYGALQIDYLRLQTPGGDTLYASWALEGDTRNEITEALPVLTLDPASSWRYSDGSVPDQCAIPPPPACGAADNGSECALASATRCAWERDIEPVCYLSTHQRINNFSDRAWQWRTSSTGTNWLLDEAFLGGASLYVGSEGPSINYDASAFGFTAGVDFETVSSDPGTTPAECDFSCTDGSFAAAGTCPAVPAQDGPGPGEGYVGIDVYATGRPDEDRVVSAGLDAHDGTPVVEFSLTFNAGTVLAAVRMPDALGATLASTSFLLTPYYGATGHYVEAWHAYGASYEVAQGTEQVTLRLWVDGVEIPEAASTTVVSPLTQLGACPYGALNYTVHNGPGLYVRNAVTRALADPLSAVRYRADLDVEPLVGVLAIAPAASFGKFALIPQYAQTTDPNAGAGGGENATQQAFGTDVCETAPGTPQLVSQTDVRTEWTHTYPRCGTAASELLTLSSTLVSTEGPLALCEHGAAGNQTSQRVSIRVAWDPAVPVAGAPSLSVRLYDSTGAPTVILRLDFDADADGHWRAEPRTVFYEEVSGTPTELGYATQYVGRAQGVCWSCEPVVLVWEHTSATRRLLVNGAALLPVPAAEPLGSDPAVFDGWSATAPAVVSSCSSGSIDVLAANGASGLLVGDVRAHAFHAALRDAFGNAVPANPGSWTFAKMPLPYPVHPNVLSRDVDNPRAVHDIHVPSSQVRVTTPHFAGDAENVDIVVTNSASSTWCYAAGQCTTHAGAGGACGAACLSPTAPAGALLVRTAGLTCADKPLGEACALPAPIPTCNAGAGSQAACDGGGTNPCQFESTIVYNSVAKSGGFRQMTYNAPLMPCNGAEGTTSGAIIGITKLAYIPFGYLSTYLGPAGANTIEFRINQQNSADQVGMQIFYRGQIRAATRTLSGCGGGFAIGSQTVFFLNFVYTKYNGGAQTEVAFTVSIGSCPVWSDFFYSPTGDPFLCGATNWYVASNTGQFRWELLVGTNSVGTQVNSVYFYTSPPSIGIGGTLPYLPTWQEGGSTCVLPERCNQLVTETTCNSHPACYWNATSCLTVVNYNAADWVAVSSSPFTYTVPAAQRGFLEFAMNDPTPSGGDESGDLDITASPDMSSPTVYAGEEWWTGVSPTRQANGAALEIYDRRAGASGGGDAAITIPYSSGTSGDWLLELRVSSPGPLYGTQWRGVTVSGRSYDAGAWRAVFSASVRHYADRIEAEWTLHRRDNSGSNTCTATWTRLEMQLRPARYWFMRAGSDGGVARVRADFERTSGGCDSSALVDGGSFWDGAIDAVRIEWSGSEEGDEEFAGVVLHTVATHGDAPLIDDVLAYDGTGAAFYHDFGDSDGLAGWTASGAGTLPAFYPSVGAFQPSALIPRDVRRSLVPDTPDTHDGLGSLPQAPLTGVARVHVGRLPSGTTMPTEFIELRVRMRADAQYIADVGGSYAAVAVHGAEHP